MSVHKAKLLATVFQFSDCKPINDFSVLDLVPKINDCGVVTNPIVFQVMNKRSCVQVTVAMVDGGFHAGFSIMVDGGTSGSSSPVVPRRCAWHVPSFNPQGRASAEVAAAEALSRPPKWLLPSGWPALLLHKVAEVFPNLNTDDYRQLLDIVSPEVARVNAGVPVGAQLTLF
jgi:hypothetical protein